VKKEKVREKGLPDSRKFHREKKEKVREKGRPDSRKFHHETKEKFVRKGFLIAKNPIHRGIPTEGPETTTSCGLEKSHPSRDSHRKARDNNKLWPRKIPSTKGFPPESSHDDFGKMNV
jgi:hypothetical protein